MIRSEARKEKTYNQLGKQVHNKKPLNTFKMKKTFFAIVFSILYSNLFAQNVVSDEQAVKSVVQKYKVALEKLDLTGINMLFTENSKIFESGKSEGSYQDYIANHIGPELKHFKSFNFTDYKVNVEIDGNHAYVIETYNYKIVLEKDNSEVFRKGVSTVVLVKKNGNWQIAVSHNSSRK